MNIGIDLDGVTFDTENWLRTFAEIYDIEIGKSGVVTAEEFLVQNRMDWTEEEYRDFVGKYAMYIEKNTPLMPGIKVVLDKLRDMGHRLIVITARGDWGPMEEDITEEVLEKHNIKFDKICYMCKDKLSKCQEEEIDYMIDDSYKHIEKLSQAGINCLYFRDVGRKKIENEHVIEVANWGDVYRFFYNLNKKDRI